MVVPLAPVPEEAFLPILRELERQPLPMNQYRKRAGVGRSAAFGFVNRRSLEPDLSRLCWQRPYLYNLLLDFGRRYVPLEGWTSITVNANFAASPHRDKGNEGHSYLVSFGDFQEGELELHEPDLSGTVQIRHSPILLDGARIIHSVRPFKGNRYSLVYYRLDKPVAKRLEQYRPVQEDGKWVLNYTDAEGVTTVLKRGQGLPHPRQRKKEESV